MHNKTYFNSLKTVFCEAPNGFLKVPSPLEKYDKENSPKIDDIYVTHLVI